jgi:hypothetical protein
LVEDAEKVKRPELDEFDLQTMQEEVGRALSSSLETRITTMIDQVALPSKGYTRSQYPVCKLRRSIW